MEHLEKLISYLLKTVNLGKLPLGWNEINSNIKEISKKINISNALKLILSTNGSVTRALEVLSGNKICVETKFQYISKLNGDSNSKFKFLKLNLEDEVNFREVWLTDGKKKFTFALSLTPIKRLQEEFKEDLLKADIPIGKLLEKYNLECRREIYVIDTVKYGILKNAGVEWNNLSDDIDIPYRTYYIISNCDILMAIVEFFHPEI